MEYRNRMIYEFSTHSLYYENIQLTQPIFSLIIDTLELEYEMKDGKLLRVTGFLPLIQAVNCHIPLKHYEDGNVYLLEKYLKQCKENHAYDILDKIPETRPYFEELNLKFDKTQGIIRLGAELTNQDKLVKVNSNIFCGIDSKDILKCVYLIPSEFID